VFVDNHHSARTEAGDILIPVARNELTYDHVIGELGDVLTGKVAGRQLRTDITLFKSVGMAMEDAVVAARVYSLARERGVGQYIELT
jgi:ornithine cyclodeaminase/alanine dehydrogenase-like protein (mu-crystallin family)